MFEKNLKDFFCFLLKILLCGYFKGYGNLRVVYLKLDGNFEKFNIFFFFVEDVMVEVGFEREKREYIFYIIIV